MRSGAAHAQLLDQYFPVGVVGHENWFSDAVLDRPRSEYDAPGIRAGDFVIRPQLSQGFGYDSNIFGLQHPVGSALAETQGSVFAGSDWSRHALDASLSFDRLQYLQHPSASQTNWSAGLGGVVDIGRDQLRLDYTHLNATTGAAQIGTLQAGQPISIAFDSARVSYQTTFGRFTLQPALAADIYRYSNGPGGVGNQSGNNNNDVIGSLTGGYSLAPGSSLVLVVSDTSTTYPTRTPGLPTQSYNDLSVIGGIDYRSGLLFRYRATVGYTLRGYASSQYGQVAAPVAEFDVIWTPSQLTTVTGQVSHNVQSAILTSGSSASGGAASYIYTTARLQLDHELRRNILLQGYAQFQNAALQSNGETQRVISAGASVTWLLNRKLSLTGRINYTQSNDNLTPALNQTDSMAVLSLNFHL